MSFEVIEALAPEHPIRLEPVVELAERLGAKLIPAPLRVSTDPNKARFTEDSEVLGHTRLTQPELPDKLSHRAGALAQQVEDAATRRLSHGCERRHGHHHTY
jgi:hypothetical protein